MVELIFVIIIIGILSAIAVPKFTQTAELAYDSKAKSTLAAVMAAVSTERQKRILRGDTTPITDLGNNTYAFNTFDGGTKPVVSTPVKNCSSVQLGCWKKVIYNGENYFTYYFSDGTPRATFKIDKSRLVCKYTSGTGLKRCERLLY